MMSTMTSMGEAKWTAKPKDGASGRIVYAETSDPLRNQAAAPTILSCPTRLHSLSACASNLPPLNPPPKPSRPRTSTTSYVLPSRFSSHFEPLEHLSLSFESSLSIRSSNVPRLTALALAKEWFAISLVQTQRRLARETREKLKTLLVPAAGRAVEEDIKARSLSRCEEARQRLVLGLVHDQEEGLRAAHQRRCLSSPFSLHLPPPPVGKCPAQCASLETERARNVLGIEWSRGKVRGKEGGSKGYAYVVKSLEWTTQGLNRTRKGVRADSVGGKERMERPEAPWCPTAAATAWAGERCADNGGSRQLLAALFHREKPIRRPGWMEGEWGGKWGEVAFWERLLRVPQRLSLQQRRQAVEDDRQICEDKVEEALETNEKKDYGEENELEQEEEEMFHDRSLVGSAITKFSFYMEALYGEEEGVRGTGKEKERASARRRAEEMEEDVKSFVFLLLAHIGPMRGGASLDSENVAWNIGEQASFARLITRCVFAVVQPWVLASCARARERETIGLMSALAALKALQEEELMIRLGLPSFLRHHPSLPRALLALLTLEHAVGPYDMARVLCDTLRLLGGEGVGEGEKDAWKAQREGERGGGEGRGRGGGGRGKEGSGGRMQSIISSDELLPLLQLILYRISILASSSPSPEAQRKGSPARCHPSPSFLPSLPAYLDLVERFLPENLKMGESGFCLCTFQGTVTDLCRSGGAQIQDKSMRSSSSRSLSFSWSTTSL